MSIVPVMACQHLLFVASRPFAIPNICSSRASQRMSSHGTVMRTGPSGRWVRGPGVTRDSAPKMNFGRNYVRPNFHAWLT